MINGRTDEDGDEFERGALGWRPPEKPEPTGYGKPPVQHQFKPGQSGNPLGRPRKRRRVEPPGDLMAAIMHEMIEPQSIKIGGKVVKMPPSTVIAKQLVADMMKDSASRYRMVKLFGEMGILHAADSLDEMRRIQESTSEDEWTADLEAAYQAIEAMFSEDGQDPLDPDDTSSGVETRSLDHGEGE
jgi:Family of unknown function (DUF5681)